MMCCRGGGRHGAGTPLGFLKGEDVTAGRRLREEKRVLLDSAAGCYGCVVPKGAWHSVEVLTPSVIYEAKDGKYGEDGSELW